MPAVIQVPSSRSLSMLYRVGPALGDKAVDASRDDVSGFLVLKEGIDGQGFITIHGRPAMPCQKCFVQKS